MKSILIVMGVSGSGKSTIGKALAEKLGWPFFEGDEFHPESNIEKMRQGIPLNDEDRQPWLLTIRKKIEERLAGGKPAVFVSSALKASYRKILRQGDERITFIFLQGSYELILNRIQSRQHKYMPVSLLKSQFDTLEPPIHAVHVSIEDPVDEIVKQVLESVNM